MTIIININHIVIIMKTIMIIVIAINAIINSNIIIMNHNIKVLKTIKISTIIIILMPPHLACYHHHHYHHRKNRHRHHRCGHTDSKCSIISIFNPKQQKQNPQHLCTSSIVLLAQFLDISPGLHKRLHCHSISIFRCRVQRAVSAAHQASRRKAINGASTSSPFVCSC